MAILVLHYNVSSIQVNASEASATLYFRCNILGGVLVINSNNPSAVKSREMFTNALLLLMDKKQYKDITIKEIASKADLDRRTFYRNFYSKEDIITNYGNLLMKELADSIIVKQNVNLYNICESYFEFWVKHIDFLRLLQKNQLLYFLFEQFDAFRIRLHGFIMPSMNENQIHEPLQYSLAFILGGLWNILIKWLNEGATKNPSDMAEIICNTIISPF